MRQIYLIKHASPQMMEGVANARWPLSAAGREAAGVLAERLGGVKFAAVVCSKEPKAAETAGILAEQWKLPLEQVNGLHEHERRHVPLLRTQEFLSLMAQVFRRPDELVLGEETADEALVRFSDAYEGILSKYPEGNLAVVTHGTVIALFLESISQEDGYQMWRRMGQPSYAVIQEPERDLREIVAAVK